jgi:outer membrane protein TolC
MKRNCLTALGFAAALSTLSACSFGPDGKPPVMPPVSHYGANGQPARTVTAEGVSQSFDAAAKPVPEWWKLYRSEPLNALVDEGLRNSPSLAATDKTLAAAREQ